MQFDFGFISSPSITDIDNDNDLEIVVGTNQNLSVIDFKEIASINNSDWITYREIIKEVAVLPHQIIF